MPQATNHKAPDRMPLAKMPAPRTRVICAPPNQAAAIIEPQIFGSAAAWSSCRAREVTGSCQSSVDTRP